MPTLSRSRSDNVLRTVLRLWGWVAVHAQDEVHLLEPGDLLALGAGVHHAVESARGGVFVLTIAACSAARAELAA